MTTLKRFVLAATVAATIIVPGSPALANHNCEADDPTLEGICEYHPSTDYKQLLRELTCIVTGNC